MITIKDLAATIPDTYDLYIRFNGDEIIYSAPLAGIVDSLVIERIEAEETITGNPQIVAIIKLQPVKKEG